MPTDKPTGLALALFLFAAPAWAEDPLSAIDWLSQSVSQPAAPAKTGPVEPPVSEGVTNGDVSVSVIGGPSQDAIGLLRPEVTGLPANLWGLGTTDGIASAIARERTTTLPALRGLLMSVLLAEATPPADSKPGAKLLLARIDKLLDLGALDQARALLDASGARSPDLFRRSFDVALLTGEEDRGCRIMVSSPGLAPTFPARIFCLARSGDWNAAALTLRTAQALGYVTPEEDALLSRFLDPDLYEGDPALTPPERVTPLAWRMFEAVGEPLPTATLPIAFAHAELRPQAGWKSQIEAAERLARAGAIAPNALLGLYTERAPAASGGVWDRVAAFQRFESALNGLERLDIEKTLPDLWSRLAEVELESPFAELYGEPLNALVLDGDARRIAFEAGLLSPAFETVIKDHTPATPREMFLTGIAKGDVAAIPAPDSLSRAIKPAFTGAALPDTLPADLQALLDDNRTGEAILSAIDRIESGVQGNLVAVTEGLTLLRVVGQEKIARRTALELMLLERRG
ncbi:hypothetical protein HYN69_08680 [Gemmobacter aquarius]|uniref:Uncharacterized protein n=1 Tax=Paragemmobacter aquarius TaxID=2169400 RepID=A0A2S0UL94_9RHOB|nr:hypothetical protein [Gemmobacter aquarius]AWB48572.1 hypothetical protein HYN69_08680 [Gemmobacter aquarius]